MPPGLRMNCLSALKYNGRATAMFGGSFWGRARLRRPRIAPHAPDDAPKYGARSAGSHQAMARASTQCGRGGHDASAASVTDLLSEVMVLAQLLDQRQLTLEPVRVVLLTFQDLREQLPAAVVAPLDTERNAWVEPCDRLFLE